MKTAREYEKRINRVIDYINDNIDGDLSLQVLARVAMFSPFHFHRIFKGIVNEPVYDYIKRLRLEKGANILVNNPYRSITENATTDGEIGLMDIPGGKHAVYHYEGTTDGLGETYDRLYGEWLPQSGFQPENRPCHELYYSNPDEHPERKFSCDICVPVTPL